MSATAARNSRFCIPVPALLRLPPPVDPEPVRRISPDGGLHNRVDITGDGFDAARAPVLPGRDLGQDLDPPATSVRAKADYRVERQAVAKAKDGGGGRGRR